AQLGYDSFAVDISFSGLKLCRGKARANNVSVHTFVADLTVYPLPVAYFDVVVITHYLDRALLAQL
ncbi:MAG: methyltransferase domain-containing protein, partial [Burkholderiales bacterium]|nr:methyltransferase domain-containing protein [Burkholderiales bacterium]